MKLHCLGNKKLLQEKKLIAVVGSRRMSSYGKQVVERIVPELVKAGYIIVSGMAFGIDAWSHKVCLDYKGKTIAVLASGVNMPTPKSNRWIYERIIRENGLIVSQFKNGTIPQPVNFLKRNEVIVDLCQKILIVEGNQTSGTLVTAKLAADQGKDVYCVPGRITDNNSFAPNFLIKNGAQIVTEINDLLI
ncbi:MAG TPA: DNA-processing protein DprA [Candidatus Woesebacteria bacterium]|nr:DNA-processing protein DprA [Candidatus Woesebacteria bacterium]HRT40310.1 DNA-processing protein DprA [Candidatus Woesebacteria bacterium]